MSAALELARLYDLPLVLRAFTPADASLVVEASTDRLIPLITTVPLAADAGAVRAFLDRQHQRAVTGQGYSFAIADARTDQGSGQIGLWPLPNGRASIGYWVAPSARRRGVARRAFGAVSIWGWPCRTCTALSSTSSPGTPTPGCRGGRRLRPRGAVARVARRRRTAPGQVHVLPPAHRPGHPASTLRRRRGNANENPSLRPPIALRLQVKYEGQRCVDALHLFEGEEAGGLGEAGEVDGGDLVA